MEYIWSVLLQLTILAFILVLVNCDESWLNVTYRVGGPPPQPCPFCQKIRTPPHSMVSHSSKGGDLVSRTPTLRPNGAVFSAPPKAVVIGIGGGRKCCHGAVPDYFKTDQFENIFSKRNSLEAHAKGFWDYQSFITASAHYQPYGFGTTYMNQKFVGTKEVAAFLAHIGTNFNLGFCIVGLVEYKCVLKRFFPSILEIVTSNYSVIFGCVYKIVWINLCEIIFSD